MITFIPMLTTRVNTGHYYYGAKYLTLELLIWMRVDPLAHEFLTLTPFHFVANNPISIIDPNGRDTTFATKQYALFVKQLVDPNSAMYDKDFANKVNDLASSKETYEFQQVKHQKNGPNKAGRTYKESGRIIIAYTTNDNPNLSILGGIEFSSLREETYHAWDYETGGLDLLNPTATNEAKAWKHAASERGLKDYDSKRDSQGHYKSYIPYYRIRNSSVGQVANWLKFGMPPALDKNNDELQGYSVPLRGGGYTGVYSSLPLK